MTNQQSFREAVSAIDSGDVTALERLLAAQPGILSDRLDSPARWLRDKVGGALDGFFERPYLLWFVAEDPVRNGKLPGNIAQITRTIIDAARREGVASLQEQLDYALRLVSWSTVARECGIQIELIDVLVDAGASLDGNPDNALVNGNVGAAEHLVRRGAGLTLGTALCLGHWEAVPSLASSASAAERQFAFVLAALNGRADGLRRMIDLGIELDAPSSNLFPHATPLHHAVSSGSMAAVGVLVEAGADRNPRDTAWNATPLQWAEYYQREHEHDERSERYAEIAAYLRIPRSGER